MNHLRKAADIGHKATVTGLIGLFGYSLYGVVDQANRARQMLNDPEQLAALGSEKSEPLPVQTSIAPQEEYKKFLSQKVLEEKEKSDGNPGSVFLPRDSKGDYDDED